MASTGKAGAATRLMAELKDLKKEKWVNINVRGWPLSTSNGYYDRAWLETRGMLTPFIVEG
jgi:hypothetical protein